MKGWRLALTFSIAGVTLGCTDPYKAIRDYGYNPLKPASIYVGPGKVYAVDTDGQGNPFFQEICRLDQDSLLKFGGAKSGTLEQDFQQKLTAESSLSASELQKFSAELGITGVREVKYSISSPSLLQIPDSGMRDIQRNLTKMDNGCLDAIQARLDSGFKVLMTQSVIAGDISYNVSFDAGISATAQAQVTAALAPKLTQKVDFTGSNNIQGKALYLGQHQFFQEFTNDNLQSLKKVQVSGK